MSDYAKELERWVPGEKKPPINLGAYDNPLTWNMLDPYGADRAHQRRPCSTHRSLMELHNIPTFLRDHCAHRVIPVIRCLRNVRPMVFGNPTNCLEFVEAANECKAFEKYYSTLVKDRWMKYTEHYTDEDRLFYPQKAFAGVPHQWTSWFYMYIASARASGWDEADPANPLWWREPNRALMRSEGLMATDHEMKMQYSTYGHPIYPPEMVQDEMAEFPLPAGKKPTMATQPNSW